MKNLTKGDRVILRETEWNGQQQADVIGIDDEVVTYCVLSCDRDRDDPDGLVEGPASDVLEILYSEPAPVAETDGEVARRLAQVLSDVRHEIFNRRGHNDEPLRVAQDLLGTVISILEARAHNVV